MDLEVVCQRTDIESPDGLTDTFAPTLKLSDLRFEGDDWRDLVGVEILQEGAWQGEGEPLADLFVIEHASISEARLRISSRRGTCLRIELDALCDIFFDDGHDTKVPLKLRTELDFPGVDFRFRAEGVDSLQPDRKALLLLDRYLDPEGFAAPVVEAVKGEPGTFHAHFSAIGEESFEEEGDEEGGPDEDSEESLGGGMDALMSALGGGDEPSADENAVLINAAGELLSALVHKELLELEEGGLEALKAPLVDVLEMGGMGEGRAARVSDWLIDRDEVIDLHIQDEDLAEILDKWW